jgi:hypothetical protein
MQDAVLTYLFQQIAGNTMTSDQLLAAAACYAKCIPCGMALSVAGFLANQVADGGSYPCGMPTGSFQLSGAGNVAVNQIYTYDALHNRWQSADGNYMVLYSNAFSPYRWHLYQWAGFPVEALYSSFAALFPCDWFIDVPHGDVGPLPVPTGHYV